MIRLPGLLSALPALLASTLCAAQAQVVTQPPPVTSVSGVLPVAGDVPFGCPLSPFSAGTNMSVNAMLSNCSLNFVGPMETQAQSAIDIAAAIAAIPAATPFAAGTPTTRTVSAATAYQATTTTKPAYGTVNLTSTAAITLSGGTTNTATVVIGSTNAVASGTGTTICNYSNSNTGTLTIGLALNTVSASTCAFVLPAGWYFAVRVTAGTVTITSAFDQSLG